jgi:L-glyceraldehyde 3-phosphate reductase
MVRDCAPGEPFEAVRRTVLEAVELGVISIDLATRYGGGSVEQAMGKILRDDLASRRDELIIGTKAGWADGSRKTLIASMDQSLRQLGLDYVDLFYHHAPDPTTPIEETAAALDLLVRQGKTLYVGISNYSPDQTRRMVALMRQAGTRCVVHQPNYNLLNRWVEDDLLGTLDQLGMGAAVFSSLAQGVLTDRSVGGPTPASRAARTLQAMAGGVAEGEPAYGRYPEGDVEQHVLHMLNELSAIAQERGQTLSQLAVAWVLRRPVVSTAIVGTSSVEQLRDTIGATDNLGFTEDELQRIEAIIPPRL